MAALRKVKRKSRLLMSYVVCLMIAINHYFKSSGSRKKASISPFVKTAVLLHLHFEISQFCWGCPFSTDLNWYLTKTVIIDPKIDFFPLLSNFSLYQKTYQNYFTVANTQFCKFQLYFNHKSIKFKLTEKVSMLCQMSDSFDFHNL